MIISLLILKDGHPRWRRWHSMRVNVCVMFCPQPNFSVTFAKNSSIAMQSDNAYSKGWCFRLNPYQTQTNQHLSKTTQKVRAFESLFNAVMLPPVPFSASMWSLALERPIFLATLNGSTAFVLSQTPREKPRHLRRHIISIIVFLMMRPQCHPVTMKTAHFLILPFPKIIFCILRI